MQRVEHGLRDRSHLLVDVVLAVERVLAIVERLGTRRRHHVADEAPYGLRGLARGLNVRRRARGVVVGRLAEVLSVHELVVELACTQTPYDVREIRIDALIGEEPSIELTLNALRKRCPVAAHDLEPDELQVAFGELAGARRVNEPGIALARAARTPA